MQQPEMWWSFVIDADGRAHDDNHALRVETVVPGEYLVTLPMPIVGLAARVDGDAGFLAAVPGDEAGNKPARIRVLTMTGPDAFGPRDFTLRLGTG
ncbi:MAG: hypothetical protein JOZ54_18975 [Acidobacteria bacterium]|nr:hypothetical protein [Acidobacteriota bacterium]